MGLESQWSTSPWHWADTFSNNHSRSALCTTLKIQLFFEQCANLWPTSQCLDVPFWIPRISPPPPFHFDKFWFLPAIAGTIERRRGVKGEEREREIWGKCCFVSRWNAGWLLMCQDVQARGKEHKACELRWKTVIALHCQVVRDAQLDYINP